MYIYTQAHTHTHAHATGNSLSQDRAQGTGRHQEGPQSSDTSKHMYYAEIHSSKNSEAEAQPADSPSFLICFCDGFELLGEDLRLEASAALPGPTWKPKIP